MSAPHLDTEHRCEAHAPEVFPPRCRACETLAAEYSAAWIPSQSPKSKSAATERKFE
jgi:hypothetical protein